MYVEGGESKMMKRIIPIMLTVFILLSLLAPLTVQQSEISLMNDASVYNPESTQNIMNVSAIERFFPMENRFQFYKNGSLLIPEKLFVSFGKGKDQNTFDINVNNLKYLMQFKLIESNFLTFQEQLSLNQLIHKEKKLDKVKAFYSSI